MQIVISNNSLKLYIKVFR